MLRRLMLVESRLAALLAFGTACGSSAVEPDELDKAMNVANSQPGAGLPPGTVVVPLPRFENETEEVQIPNAVGFLYAEILGERDEAIVIVSGGPGLNSAFVERVHQGMAERLPGRRVVRYDQRGTGRSTATTAEENTIAGAVEDVESVREFLGVSKVHLVKQSFGGLISGAYASTHDQNVASIAFIAPTPSLPADSEFTTRGNEDITMLTIRRFWTRGSSKSGRTMTLPRSLGTGSSAFTSSTPSSSGSSWKPGIPPTRTSRPTPPRRARASATWMIHSSLPTVPRGALPARARLTDNVLRVAPLAERQQIRDHAGGPRADVDSIVIPPTAQV